MILIATLPEVLVLDEAITAHPSLRSLDIATAQRDRSEKKLLHSILGKWLK